MTIYRARASLKWQAAGFALLFWGMFVANVILVIQTGVTLIGTIFPCLLWLAMGTVSLAMANSAFGSVSVDEEGIALNRLIGAKSMRWTDVTRVESKTIERHPALIPRWVFSPRMNSADAWVTTANSFEGFRIVRYLGVVRGITVRSASALGNFAAGIQGMFGGNVTAYTELAENSRFEAYELMISHAAQLGANAVIAMRYDATEVAQGMTEVLAYGTAVVIEAIPQAHA